MKCIMALVVGLILQCFATSVRGSSADIVESSIAAAAGNVTALQSQIAPSWVSSSHVRGTTDILWSCLLTLAACIYNAIHLNVPPMHERKWRPIWRKARWVLTALLAPEIVLYCAISQFIEAKALVKELNRIRRGEYCEFIMGRDVGRTRTTTLRLVGLSGKVGINHARHHNLQGSACRSPRLLTSIMMHHNFASTITC